MPHRVVTSSNPFRRLRALSRTWAWRFALAALLGIPAAGAALAEPSHAIAMQGTPALPPDFKALRYADPQAPKGGRLVQGVLGSFDSLNPFIVRGLAPQGVRAPLVSGSNIIANRSEEHTSELQSL